MKEALGILGRKIGQTQIFDEKGRRVPVTVVEAGPCVVVQKKTEEKDGYTALQLGFGKKRGKNVSLPLRGHLRSAGFGVQAKGKKSNTALTAKQLEKESKEYFPRFLKEFRIPARELENYEAGQEIKCDIFTHGQKIDVSGISKGKGYAGVMKRHNFGGFRATHGTHECFRHGGSIGQKEFPAKVWKGRKMAGQMGNERVTVQNIEVAKVILEDNLLLLKGAVP
ncbi:MAG: 50S ribosomal protein L3, partial [Deltaproteobacteria bacterium]|nr:50S ribosomal protein L3 [Deltaproteobacteria bacterium]